MQKPEDSAAEFRFDRKFLDRLSEDPKRVMVELGVEPTPEILAAIAALDFDPLYKLADAFPAAFKPLEPTLGVEAKALLGFP
jgi:hypothetical protein